MFERRDFAIAAALVRHPQGDLLIDTGFGRAEQFSGLLWRDLLVGLLLGVTERGGPREIAAGARDATAAFLRIHS